jgi:hypothetical protein
VNLICYGRDLVWAAVKTRYRGRRRIDAVTASLILSIPAAPLWLSAITIDSDQPAAQLPCRPDAGCFGVDLGVESLDSVQTT